MAVPIDIGIARRILIRWPWFLKCYKMVKVTKYNTWIGKLSTVQMIGLGMGIGALIRVIQLGKLYYGQIRACKLSIECGNSEYYNILRKVCMSMCYRQHILLIVDKKISSPMCIGIRKVYIILPDEEFSETELKYIFSHEVMHLKNHDLFFLMFSNILNRIFWWNPLTYVIRSELEYALDVRCDVSVTEHYTQEERTEYLNTILKVMSIGIEKGQPIIGNTIGFAKNSYKKAMFERFQAVQNEEVPKGSSKVVFRTWCLTMLGILLCSYLVLLVPYYSADEEKNEWQNESISDDEMWVTLNEEGQYVLHFMVDGEEVQKIMKDNNFIIEEKGLEVKEE